MVCQIHNTVKKFLDKIKKVVDKATKMCYSILRV